MSTSLQWIHHTELYQVYHNDNTKMGWLQKLGFDQWDCILDMPLAKKNNCVFLYDRSCTINKPFVHWPDPLDQIKPQMWSSNIFTCVQKVTAKFQNYIDKIDKPIHIHWSGGIDSTHIICCILEFLPQQYWSRIYINLDSNSINSYYDFYQNFIKPNFKTILHRQPKPTTSNNDIHISGNGADKLLITEEWLDFLYQTECDIDISRTQGMDHLQKYLGTILLQEQQDYFLEIIDTTALNQGQDIETIRDIFWWFGFNFLYAGNISLNVINDHSWPWFNQVEYHIQSMMTRGGFGTQGSFTQRYKGYLKDIIYKTTHDQYYRDRRIKSVDFNYFHTPERRVRDNFLPYTQDRCALDSNGNWLSLNNLSDYLRTVDH